MSYGLIDQNDEEILEPTWVAKAASKQQFVAKLDADGKFVPLRALGQNLNERSIWDGRTDVYVVKVAADVEFFKSNARAKGYHV